MPDLPVCRLFTAATSSVKALDCCDQRGRCWEITHGLWTTEIPCFYWPMLWPVMHPSVGGAAGRSPHWQSLGLSAVMVAENEILVGGPLFGHPAWHRHQGRAQTAWRHMLNLRAGRTRWPGDVELRSQTGCLGYMFGGVLWLPILFLGGTFDFWLQKNLLSLSSDRSS